MSRPIYDVMTCSRELLLIFYLVKKERKKRTDLISTREEKSLNLKPVS